MASSTTDIDRDEIIDQYLRENFTSRKCLSKASSMRDSLRQEIEKLENQLSVASTEIPTKIDSAIDTAENTKRHISGLEEKVSKVQHAVSDYRHEVKPMIGELGALVNEVEVHRRHAQYLSVVTHIEDLQSQIQSQLITESLTGSVDIFTKMTVLYEKLKTSTCANLVSYLKDTILFWHKILCERISEEFSSLLTALRWPLVASTLKSPSVSNVSDLKDRLGI